MHSPVWAAVILAASATAFAALVTLHLLPTGLSPRRNPASHYGITDYRLGYRVLTIGLGVAGLATAIALAMTVPDSAQPRGVVTVLLLFAVSRAAISWFPKDAPGAQRTRHAAVPPSWR